MCKFFSFVTNGQSDRYYFTDKQRKELNGTDLNFDSHASICKHFHLKEDNCNKYEYNPLTQEFTVDQINNPKDDHVRAKNWVKKLDFKTVVKELVIRPIVHPFQIDPPKITEVHIELLKKWASVGDSVRDSVGDSVYGYISYFFVLDEWKYTDAKGGVNPFESVIDLWNMGIVPSFDGKTWRLHTKNGIAWKGTV